MQVLRDAGIAMHLHSVLKHLATCIKAYNLLHKKVLLMVHHKLYVYSNISFQISQVEKQEHYATQNIPERAEKMHPWGEVGITGTV